MFFNKATDKPAHLVDQAADSANQAIQAVQQEAHQALDGLAGAVKDLHDETMPQLERVQREASLLKQRGLAAVRDGTQQLRDQAGRVSDSTASYIQQEPMKAMLMAAAAGAALVALASLLTRSSPRG